MRILAFLMILFTPLFFYGKPFWKIKNHTTNIETLDQEMKNIWLQGYSPVGMEQIDDDFFVLYIDYQDFAQDYYLEVIDLTTQTEDSLPTLMNRRIEDNYLPISMTISQNLLYIAFLKSSISVLEWDLIPLPASYREQEKALNAKGQQGLIPFAITQSSGRKFALMIRSENWPVQEWLLKSYKPGSAPLRKGLNTSVRDGWIPWGMMMDKKETVILYIKQ